jgi:folate-binding protein YgfZ
LAVALEDRLRLLLPLSVRESARAHFAKYAVFQKVEVHDRSDELARLAVYGEAEELGSALPAGAIVLPGEGEIARDLLVATAGLEAALGALRASGAREMPEEEAEALRIEAGRPEYGRDADESNLVDEAGLAEAVSATKGCYVGQEIVARLRTYGRVNRRLVGFRFPDGLVPAGTILRRPGEASGGAARVEAGRVTSAATSTRRGAIGLGYAFRDVAPGDRLEAADGPSAGRSAVVASLPLV